MGVSNSVLWAKTANGVMLDEAAQVNGAATVTYRCVMDEAPDLDFPFGPTNIDRDPLFVNAAFGNYRVLPLSPVIDHADNDPVILLGIAKDLDGKPLRIYDPDTEPDPGNGEKPVVDRERYD